MFESTQQGQQPTRLSQIRQNRTPHTPVFNLPMQPLAPDWCCTFVTAAPTPKGEGRLWLRDDVHIERPILRATILISATTLAAIGYGAIAAWLMGVGLSVVAVVLLALVGAIAGACIT